MQKYCPDCKKVVEWYQTGSIEGRATTYYDLNGDEIYDEGEMEYWFEDYYKDSCYCVECGAKVNNYDE